MVFLDVNLAQVERKMYHIWLATLFSFLFACRFFLLLLPSPVYFFVERGQISEELEKSKLYREICNQDFLHFTVFFPRGNISSKFRVKDYTFLHHF